MKINFGQTICIQIPGFVNKEDRMQPTTLYQIKDMAKRTNAGMITSGDKIILSSSTIQKDLDDLKIRYWFADESDIFEKTK